MADDIVEIEGKIVRETDKAVLFDVFDPEDVWFSEEVWIPKRQIRDEDGKPLEHGDSIYDLHGWDDLATLRLSVWFAAREGLIVR